MKLPRVLAAALASLLLAACALNPFAYAKTPMDKAHVTLSGLEILQTEILALVQDSTIPSTAKSTLRDVSHAATLAATELANAVIEVEAARAELIAGATTSERLKIANARLVQWTGTLLSRIKSIESVLKEIKGHG